MIMKTTSSSKVVDVGALVCAAIASGFVSLMIICFVVPHFTGGNAGIMLRNFAAVLLGEGILPPPATLSAAAFFAGCFVHFAFSFIFSAILALITHRWGLLTGIFLGAAFGLCLYAINVYSMTAVFPWFMFMKHPAFLITHVIFGMTSGGVYELLDDDDEGGKAP